MKQGAIRLGVVGHELHIPSDIPWLSGSGVSLTGRAGPISGAGHGRRVRNAVPNDGDDCRPSLLSCHLTRTATGRHDGRRWSVLSAALLLATWLAALAFRAEHRVPPRYDDSSYGYDPDSYFGYPQALEQDTPHYMKASRT